MSTTEKKCCYELLGEERYQCPQPVKMDGLCVFHVPKVSPDERTKLSAGQLSDTEAMESEFKIAFDKLVEQAEVSELVGFYDFRGFYFPSLRFARRIFRKDLKFEHAVFSTWVDFSFVVFECPVSFDCARFLGGVSFVRAVFNRRAEFMDTVFGIDGLSSNFYHASFKDESAFLGARFEGHVSFRNVTFADVGEFAASTFSHGGDFQNATFQRSASFGIVTANGRLSFRNTTFSQSAIFNGGVFSDEVLFIGDLDHKCFIGECDFSGLRLKKDATLIFERLSLERATFLDTNLEDVIVRDVDWHCGVSNLKALRLARMQALWDEFRPLKTRDRDYHKIAENYSQLVLNYERKRDFETAEDFHVGEMEMRRKKKGVGFKTGWLRTLREWTNAYGAYRISSVYGTSYVRGLAMLVLFMIVFSLAFLYTGFQEVQQAGRPTHIVEYNLFADSGHQSVGLQQWVMDMTSALSLSASIITFQKDRFYEPLPGIARLWLYVAIVVLAGQAALVLLAIRRRFKR